MENVHPFGAQRAKRHSRDHIEARDSITGAENRHAAEPARSSIA